MRHDHVPGSNGTDFCNSDKVRGGLPLPPVAFARYPPFTGFILEIGGFSRRLPLVFTQLTHTSHVLRARPLCLELLAYAIRDLSTLPSPYFCFSSLCHEEQVTGSASNLLFYLNLTMVVPSLFVVTTLGAYSDKVRAL